MSFRLYNVKLQNDRDLVVAYATKFTFALGVSKEYSSSYMSSSVSLLLVGGEIGPK